MAYFNPRTPVGCDLPLSPANPTVTVFQSTHPSGVRLGVGCSWCGLVYFNPRTPVGCDAINTHNHRITVPFQSTHPSGVRQQRPIQAKDTGRISIHAPQWGATRDARGLPDHTQYFNPRTPVGCDAINTHNHRITVPFQSTHPSGVRQQRPIQAKDTGRISIHAPQWGATRDARGLPDHTQYFNPRTPVGCDAPPE